MAHMTDYLGNPLQLGDKVAIYFGGGSLQTAYIAKFHPKYQQCKVRMEHYPSGEMSTKWKSGDCMVKI